jgi:hypothetical protein
MITIRTSRDYQPIQNHNPTITATPTMMTRTIRVRFDIALLQPPTIRPRPPPYSANPGPKPDPGYRVSWPMSGWGDDSVGVARLAGPPICADMGGSSGRR